jgi:hypothetical protein
MEWKASTLAVGTLYNPGTDRESSMEEIWTLSEDGKKLIDQMVYHLPAKQPGDVRVRRVFEKQ